MFKKFFLSIFFVLITINAYSLEKIIIVDVDYLLNKSKAGTNIQEQLKKKNDNRIKKLKSKDKEFKDKESKLIAQKNILSKEDFKNKADALKKEIINFNSNNKKELDLTQKKRNEAVSKLLVEINKLLIDYSKKNEISMILDKKNVIISKNENDITEEILGLLNNKVSKIKVD